MKEFIYKAYEEGSSPAEGFITAESREEAAEKIFGRGLHLVHLEEVKEEKKALLWGAPFSSRRTLSLFAEEWASLLEAGLTLTESLSLLEDQANTKERKVLKKIGKTISTGRGVWESFRRARCFPPFFLSLLQVGELSGTLPEELRRISVYYEKEDLFLQKIKSALAYPTFVVLFALFVFLIILTFILPSFALLFEALSLPLPPVAEAALSLGLFLKEKGFLLLLFLLCFLLFSLLFLRTKKGKGKRDEILYRSKFYRRLLLIRFCFTLSALLESGRTMSESLSATREVLDNRSARRAMKEIQEKVTRGGDFSKVLKESGFSLPIVTHLARVGMESGELPRFLRHAGKILTRDAERKINRFRAILEPAVLLTVGILTAVIVFSVMLPVFTAAGSHIGG